MKNINIKGFTFRYGYGDYHLCDKEGNKVKHHVFIGETTGDFTPECVHNLFYYGIVSRLFRSIQPYVMEQLEDKPVVYTGNIAVYVLHKDNLYLLNGLYINAACNEESCLVEKVCPYRFIFIKVPNALKANILTLALEQEYIPSYTQVHGECILKAAKENTYLAVLEQANYNDGIYLPTDFPNWVNTDKQIKRSRLDELAGHITKYCATEDEFLSFIKDTLK